MNVQEQLNKVNKANSSLFASVLTAIFKVLESTVPVTNPTKFVHIVSENNRNKSLAADKTFNSIYM